MTASTPAAGSRPPTGERPVNGPAGVDPKDPHRVHSTEALSFWQKLMQTMGLVSLEGSRATESDARRQYARPRSFADFMTIKHYSRETGCYLHPDERTLGKILMTQPINSEARPEEQLEQMLDDLENGFRHIPEYDDNPFVVQIYAQDEPLAALAQSLRNYIARNNEDMDAYAEHYLELQNSHYESIGKRGGIFTDSTAGVRWGGKNRRTRLCIYRRYDSLTTRDQAGRYAHDDFNRVIAGIVSGLEAASVKVDEVGPAEAYQWLFSWINPKPFEFEGALAFFRDFPIRDEDIPEEYDIGQGCVRHCPGADAEHGTWEFNGLPHRYLPIVGVRSEPRTGVLTTENEQARKKSAALIDQLPGGAVFQMTIIFKPQDTIGAELDIILKQSRSGAHSAMVTREDIENVKHHMALEHRLYPTTMGIYLRSDTLEALSRQTTSVIYLLQSHGMDAVLAEHDLMPLEAYVRNLPMAYRPEYDEYLMRQRKHWIRWMLALSPLWGQGTGTGNPCFGFFNRAGVPVLVDPFNLADREQSGHMLLFGPTGSGKSATLNYLIMQVMATHNPYIYVIDVGDSYRLIGEYLKRHGKTVNYVNLDAVNHPLPPFANADRLLDAETGTDTRDYLSEMVAAAKLIITGGEQREMEEFRRHDLTIIQSAILFSARQCRAQGRQMMISDFVRALGMMMEGQRADGLPHYDDPARRGRISQMHDSAKYFTTGFRKALFDSPGELWPTADLTIVEMGRIATSDEYRDVMALAYIGLMNQIQSDAERRRSGSRFSWVLNDEAHVTTTNPLLSDYLVKGSKMWRKWGLWMCLATQNLKDFPDASEKILNMCEWWMCLQMPIAEIDDIARFKRVSDEERRLMESTRKEPGKYVEGVLMSGKLNPTLFRVVSPPIAMALAQTEQEERARRFRMMEEAGLTDEIEGVRLIAEQMMQRRAGA